jgi:hypothetical protein
MPRLCTILGAFALVLLGCGDDGVPASEGTGDGSGDATTTSGSGSTTTSSTGTGLTVDSGSESGSTGEPAEQLEYARGIRLVRVTANQAVQVELVQDGIAVEPDAYNTRMITGRRMLIRGFWTLHAEFEPREILGVLTLRYPDGTERDLEWTQLIEGESSDGGTASFQWLLEPEDVVPGMTFRAKLLEPDPDDAPGEVSDPPPIAPLAGPAEIALHDAPLQINIVLVPILHQFMGCEDSPMVTEQDAEDMRMQIEQNNAVQEAIVTVREPMPYTDTIGEAPGFSPILAELAATRAADEVEDNVYYYGLIQPCDGFPPGLLGQALGIPDAPTRENAGQRVSTGRWNGSGLLAAETFVHEVGHSQGRRHVRCSGGEAGVDPEYPHENGRIGVWGFGIYDFQLHTPTGGRDYMTYCSSEFVSDYGWEQTLDTIEVLTSWDFEDAEPLPGRVLAGVLHEDGTSDWWTRRGAVSAHRMDPSVVVEFEIAGAKVRSAAMIDTVTHGSARYVEVPLPEGFDRSGTAALHLDGATMPIDVGAVKLLP